MREFVNELRQNPTLLKSQQDFAQDLFLAKFDLTKQLKKILKPEVQSESCELLNALVLGNSSNDLHGQLTTLGFQRIEHSNVTLLDVQDLLSLARSLKLRQFCVFYANTEVLDGFLPALSEVIKVMKKQGSQFATIPTVALSQGGQKFAPVILSKTGTVPLNGLVVDLNQKNLTFSILTKKVPFLRVNESSELPQIPTFHDSYSFLLNLARDPKREFEGSLRWSVRTEFERHHLRNCYDLVEEIRVLPRTRRRVLGYSLMAALPYTKPIAAVVKWFIRKKS